MKEPLTLKELSEEKHFCSIISCNLNGHSPSRLRFSARQWLEYLKQFQARDSGERQGVMGVEYFIKKFFNLEDK
mgnify:CR=1 FL=1